MPTYSYKCTECGHAFEIHQAFSDNALTSCPECGGKLRKVFSAVGIQFKGEGFYHTDSRPGVTSSIPATPSEPTAAKSDASGSAASGSTGATAAPSGDKKSTSTAASASSSAA